MRRMILVVDDEPAVLSLLCSILSSRGYVVAGAASGEQALKTFAACGPFDLVLADVAMPRMSGPELADRLWEKDPGLRVLFIAGLPDTPVIRSAIFDRGLPLLPKPFLPRDLVARIEEVLRAPAPMLHPC
jgi:two-component system, cell cycle sensor histidine kinase and response regulator CckA